ncbi:SLC13 family permease [uncultured Flavonifractor sp.]|uniref:SLC13 family permease n=1 Tax=uncultured Flavonifractor sp. TaxID=1193534 RepID=UPI002605540B|nr:SLC13 family permease [uncultured Flavonifractor sp.]
MEQTKRPFWKREPVLCIAAVCAAASMALNPPSAAYLNYIDWRVLTLLFCLMAVVAGLQECGVFAVLAQRLLAGERRMRFVTLALVLLPFFVSMLVTNDVALITFVPFAVLVLGLIGRMERLIYVVVLQTIAANLGSMATPVGNPQNLYIYANYELSAGQFFSAMLPLTLVSLVGLTVACLCVKPEGIRVTFAEKAEIRSPGHLILMILLFVLCLLSVFRVLPYPALLPVVLAGMLIFDRSLFRKVDYGLLATFFCFFLFAGNVGACGPVREVLTRIMEQNTALASGVSSQIISNVPAAVLLSGFTTDWHGLLLGTNIGGLGTPIASLASLISLKAYLKSPGARLGRYLLAFTVANVVALAVLVGSVALMGLIPA